MNPSRARKGFRASTSAFSLAGPYRTGQSGAERNATVGYCAQTVRFELPLLWYPSVAMTW